MKKALIVFTRVPIEGHTKTRLSPYFSLEDCVSLHIAILKDLSMELRKLKDIDIYIFYDIPKGYKKDISILRKIFGKNPIYKRQPQTDIGNRMYTAMLEVKKLNYDMISLVGSDIPKLSSYDIKKSFHSLLYKDIVLGATKDGGYYLIGMKEIDKEVFNIEKYGNDTVLKNTIDNIKNREKSFEIVGLRQDIDTKEDIIYFRNKLRVDKKLRASNLGSFLIKSLSIAIIIPTYNEEKTIEKLQTFLYPLIRKCEIIFVDGGSTDRTIELIDKRFKVLVSKKGRSNQMNFGAQNTDADVLFFLHSDSELPKNSLEQIKTAIAESSVACFGIAFRSFSPLMFICRYISNHRVFDRKIMFGDQGIFIDRNLFFEIGEFPDLPIMEDYELSLKLKKKGIKPAMTQNRIYTSARRFKGNTYEKLKLMWKMNRLRKMYRDGVDINKIAKLYKDVR